MKRTIVLALSIAIAAAVLVRVGHARNNTPPACWQHTFGCLESRVTRLEHKEFLMKLQLQTICEALRTDPDTAVYEQCVPAP